MLENSKNIIFDNDYSSYIKQGGYPKFSKENLTQEAEDKASDSSSTKNQQKENSQEKSNSKSTKKGKNNKKNGKNKKGFLDNFMELLFPPSPNQKKKKNNGGQNQGSGEEQVPQELKNKKLEDQIKHIISLPDSEFSEKLLTQDLKQHISKTEKEYLSSLADYKSHIAPSYWEVKPSYFNISGVYGKTYYANSYPSYIDFLWTRDVLSYHSKWDMSWFIYPADDNTIQSVLKRRATQLKAEIGESQNKGITIDSEVELEYRDVEDIRQKLATREEKYFETSFYMNIYNDQYEKLGEEGQKFEQKVGGYGVRIKPSTQRMDEGFNSTTPLGIDDLGIYRSMVSTSLAGSFPFISNDLIENSGILYGVNLHTGSLVVFDRFSSQLPNANSLVLATSGAGKSFAVKLEILRYLLLGVDVMVIDPENEYKGLLDKVGGTYVNIAINSGQNINPFDLPPKIEDMDYAKGDLLRSQIMNLIGLISVLIGGVSAEEEALLDKALQETYALKDITFENEDPTGKTPPIMEDLLNVLEGMDGGNQLAVKLSKYVTGTFGKLFNNHTNVDLDSGLTVFSIRDLEDALKTPAMYNVLNFIWSKVRAKKRKRLLVVDESWIMLQHDMSANFLFGLIKRARKYGLGVTTITQDIEDFVNSDYGKPIVSNSAMQLLLKQSTTSIKPLEELLGLSEAEKQKLVSANVGEGLFFAGSQHVGLKILPSPHEREFITTDVN